MNDAIMIIIRDDFQVHRFIKCLREWKFAKKGSFRLQTSQGRSYLEWKGNRVKQLVKGYCSG